MSDIVITHIQIQHPNLPHSNFYNDELGVDKLSVNYGPACVTVETRWENGDLNAIAYPWREVTSVVVSAQKAPTLPPPTRGTMQVPA